MSRTSGTTIGRGDYHRGGYLIASLNSLNSLIMTKVEGGGRDGDSDHVGVIEAFFCGGGEGGVARMGTRDEG